MIIPKNLEELASYVESDQKVVFFFTADWCPDCQFIYPVMPEIEALHPDMTFVRVNRDDYMALAQTWNIFGIPSFVVTDLTFCIYRRNLFVACLICNLL